MSSATGSSVRDVDDNDMGRLYVLVLICHTLVITALWLFGRAFSS